MASQVRDPRAERIAIPPTSRPTGQPVEGPIANTPLPTATNLSLPTVPPALSGPDEDPNQADTFIHLNASEPLELEGTPVVTTDAHGMGDVIRRWSTREGIPGLVTQIADALYGCTDAQYSTLLSLGPVEAVPRNVLAALMGTKPASLARGTTHYATPDQFLAFFRAALLQEAATRGVAEEELGEPAIRAYCLTALAYGIARKYIAVSGATIVSREEHPALEVELDQLLDLYTRDMMMATLQFAETPTETFETVMPVARQFASVINSVLQQRRKLRHLRRAVLAIMSAARFRMKTQSWPLHFDGSPSIDAVLADATLRRLALSDATATKFPQPLVADDAAFERMERLAAPFFTSTGHLFLARIAGPDYLRHLGVARAFNDTAPWLTAIYPSPAPAPDEATVIHMSAGPDGPTIAIEPVATDALRGVRTGLLRAFGMGRFLADLATRPDNPVGVNTTIIQADATTLLTALHSHHRTLYIENGGEAATRMLRYSPGDVAVLMNTTTSVKWECRWKDRSGPYGAAPKELVSFIAGGETEGGLVRTKSPVSAAVLSLPVAIGEAPVRETTPSALFAGESDVIVDPSTIPCVHLQDTEPQRFALLASNTASRTPRWENQASLRATWLTMFDMQLSEVAGTSALALLQLTRSAHLQLRTGGFLCAMLDAAQRSSNYAARLGTADRHIPLYIELLCSQAIVDMAAALEMRALRDGELSRITTPHVMRQLHLFEAMAVAATLLRQLEKVPSRIITTLLYNEVPLRPDFWSKYLERDKNRRNR